MNTTQIAGLNTRIVERAGLAATATTVVLMHGFGAPGDDLVSLAGALRAEVRWVFPEAPVGLGGMYGEARAWWMIDMNRLERQMRAGGADLSTEVPAGLHEARAQMLAFLTELDTRFSGKLVLGGFSQGSMMAVDLALHREVPPAALVLYSSTVLAKTEWQPLLPRLAGIPVLQSHGRQDMVLPYSAAESLRDLMTTAGAIVEWIPFAGGHEIPRPVLAATDALLMRL